LVRCATERSTWNITWITSSKLVVVCRRYITQIGAKISMEKAAKPEEAQAGIGVAHPFSTKR
jgi:hypothetical protein